MEEMLIIPDVHGRTFWREPCNNWKGKIIFLGDYFDPYPQEGITDEMAYVNAIEVFKFIERNSDRVIALLGNHDLHLYNCRNYCIHNPWYRACCF